jgi:hypothetical protein
VGGAHDLIDHKGRFLTCLRLPETDAEIQALALAGHGSICHPCAMVRRLALAAVGVMMKAYPWAMTWISG